MWKLPLIEARTSSTVHGDVDIVAVFQDAGKKAIPPKGPYQGWVERLRKGDAFTGKLGTVEFSRFTEKGTSDSVLFVGLGQVQELTEEKLRVAGAAVWARLCKEKVKIAITYTDSFFEVKGGKSETPHARLMRAFAEGLILNAYKYEKYRTKKDPEGDYFGPSQILFWTREKSLKTHLDPELSQVRALGEAVRVTRDWSNEPSNHGTPQYFAQEAKKLARQYGLKYKVLTEKDAVREKMGLYLGVGKGSSRENQFVVVEYTPKNVKSAKTIALVGKGVTFDSGGISIKPSMRMEEMKHDMTGAATVFGAVLLAAAWQVPNRVIAFMAFVENMPDGEAIQPGNVITARNGKTVEVINTDAEGRLILADALDYAQDYKPDAVVDVATLTGAVSIALGKHCCAVLGNEETVINGLIRAGEVAGERIWQLPLFDEYFEDLKSDYADMKNSANDSNGGTIRGAIFLKQFIRKGTQWAHLDIASTAYNLGHLPYMPKKGASGLYVRTLAQFVADF